MKSLIGILWMVLVTDNQELAPERYGKWNSTYQNSLAGQQIAYKLRLENRLSTRVAYGIPVRKARKRPIPKACGKLRGV